MMRPLVMDFPKDAKARTLTDEYQFGPAFLVAPVTTPKARSRAVYLPAGAEWYNFWSGKPAAGGTTVDAPAPLDEMPLFVKAGAIIPVGPELQYVGEKPSDPTTLYVYQGSNGAFTIYEDSGVTYDYEKGVFSEIPLHWNNASKTLTIGARKGTFPGMLEKRTFHVVVVSKTQATGFSFAPKLDKTVAYTGKALTIKL
jgi:alpha-D-xyloside xylohydrolase